jgi:hypothetical protein
MNYHKMAISTVCASAIPWIVSFEPAPMHPTTTADHVTMQKDIRTRYRTLHNYSQMLFAVSFDQTTDGSDEVVSKEVG